MLGRDPSRIEFKSDYQLEMQRAKEEYIQEHSGQQGALARAKERQRQQLFATTAPPPTPANAIAGSSSGSNSGGGGSGNGTGSNTASYSEKQDPVEVVQREKRIKTTAERIGI
ncbi:hypothetical protein BG004_006184 [Podila humilis]|nr:hypothetical protein BG004_006184 [Podila humilis]